MRFWFNENKKIQIPENSPIEMSEPLLETKKETFYKKKSLSIFQLLKENWKNNLLFTCLDSMKIGLMGYGLIHIETLITDYNEGDSPLKDFTINILLPFIGAKLINTLNHTLMTRSISNQAAEVNTVIIKRYFYSQQHETADEDKVIKLIFDAFDSIRPSLTTVHEDIIFKVFEMAIYGGIIVWSEKCQLFDVAIVTGTSSFVAIAILIIEKLTDRIKKHKKKYKFEYADTYEYISTILKNFETIRVYRIEDELINDVTKRLREFTNSIKFETYQYKFGVTISEIILFGTMISSVMSLAYFKNYGGSQFFYLFIFALQQSKNLSDLVEAFYRVFKANFTFNEIERYIEILPRKIPKLKLSEPPRLINFNNVKCKELEDINFSINQGDKIIIEGPTGCGKSSLLKLLAAIIFPVEGNISIDKIESDNISNLRDYFSYIPSSPAILPYSLRENIKIADIGKFKDKKDDSSEVPDSVSNAALKLGLKDNIFKASTLYTDESDIKNLSWRQQKKISLIRLFLKLTSVILLDNPLAGLDNPEFFLNSLYDDINCVKPGSEDFKSSSSSGENYTILMVEYREEFKKHKIHQLFNKVIRFKESGDIRLFEVPPSVTADDKGKYIGKWSSPTGGF